MTAKEQLVRLVEACSEAETEDMLRVLDELELAIRPDTSAEAINRRLGLEPISAEEFEQHFARLRTDEEG